MWIKEPNHLTAEIQMILWKDRHISTKLTDFMYKVYGKLQRQQKLAKLKHAWTEKKKKLFGSFRYHSL